MAESLPTPTAPRQLESSNYLNQVQEVARDAFGRPNRMQLVALLSSCAIAAGALAAAEGSQDAIASLQNEQQTVDSSKQ